MSAERFRGLARSSPRRWRTLEFTLDWWLPERPFQRVHAWVERPDQVRVESESGVVLADDAGRSDLFFENYYWVALLDPSELAGGTDVDAVAVVEHHGRAAVEAIVVPTEDYDARCTCCALLPCELADVYEGLAPRPAGFTYPDRFLARVDLQTGVCVYLEAIGGTRSGVQHDAAIIAVG